MIGMMQGEASRIAKMLDLKNLRGSDPFLDALRSLSCPVFLVERCDDGFRMTHLSPALQLATGVDLDALDDKRIDRIFPARMADAITANYERALASDDAIHFDESHLLNASDTWWRTTLARAPDSLSGRVRVVGFTSEITDMKSRETGLVADLAELRLAHGETQMLAGLTAHDMRAPLANVISLTGIVLDGFRDLGDGKRDMIAACRDVAQSSIDAIDGLMRRMVKDPSTTRRTERVDLAGISNAIAGLVDPTCRLNIAAPERMVECDAVVLHVCLRNLLDNAARFARSRIDITLADDADRGMIGVRVHDDGPGAIGGHDPVAQAARAPAAHDPAFRDPTGGSRGFGLSTILRLLKGQGGTLRYHGGAPDAGATFYFELPGRVLPERVGLLSA